ncbi:hypothetical protein ElyMa_004514900 [Elysia marginata]|uniref:Uncharacterized protein n=1 Tax=Elysia marginata TaxID=1093978 RepID=A0AAV4HNM3_9GAST|nr:hypothetical protein ElyMa_004514900 [Elysia marginata]
MDQMVANLYKKDKIVIKKVSVINGHGKTNSENYRPEADGGEQPDNQEPVAELYKKIQHGGDIPIRGLQKPAPEKNKSSQTFISKSPVQRRSGIFATGYA